MNEWQLIWLLPLRFLAILIYVMIYVISGRKRFLIFRRWVGGIIFGLSIILLSSITGSYSAWLWAIVIFYPLAFFLFTYGESNKLPEVLKRGFYGASFGLIGLYVGCLTGNVAMGVYQFQLATIGSLFFGLINPTNPVMEEASIATLSILLVPFIV